METDIGLYAEDDWKARDNLTISYGVRLEAQNYISSTHDFAPRTSIAYGVPRKNGKKTITVLRGGFGLFYNRFGLGQITNIIQGNPEQPDQHDLPESRAGLHAHFIGDRQCGLHCGDRLQSW